MTEKLKLIGKDKDGDVNVVKDYSWTVSTQALARAEAPRIIIEEFQQSASNITQAIKFFASYVGRSTVNEGNTILSSDAYSNLYGVDKEEKGNKYTLPYFAEYHHNITNTWGENKGTIGETVSRVLDLGTQIARAFYPSAGIESAKSWEGSRPVTYNFSFHLLNTINPSVDIERNKTFIDTILHNNLPDKLNVIGIRPPAICLINIPGIRAKNIAVLSNINIQNTGQFNYMKINGQEFNIPDAYLITIEVQELLAESRQIFNGAIKDEKVFSDIKASNITGAVDKTIDTLKGAQKALEDIAAKAGKASVPAP